MLIFLLLFTIPALAQEFREHTIATGLRGGYQVVPYDMNRDNKPDLIALASGMPELVWYENPGWQRHVIAGPFSRMINLAIEDVDGDGTPEIALAHEFANVAKNSVGILSILRLENGKWTAKEIDRIPTSHRLRWADVFGTGRKVLINSVLTSPAAEPPGYEGETGLYFYDPKDWKRQAIPTENRGVVHGIYITDWNGDKKDDVLTASFVGIHAHEWSRKWKREEVSKGAADPGPKGGSSDVAVGKLKKTRFLAAIEPWHGNTVAVYTGKRREVIDTGLVDGHTIATADLNGDGKDEIIAGCRGGPRAVYLYEADASGWKRGVLDEGDMAAAACVALDLNGDKRADVACIGSATQNLRWYENMGASSVQR